MIWRFWYLLIMNCTLESDFLCIVDISIKGIYILLQYPAKQDKKIFVNLPYCRKVFLQADFLIWLCCSFRLQLRGVTCLIFSSCNFLSDRIYKSVVKYLVTFKYPDYPINKWNQKCWHRHFFIYNASVNCFKIARIQKYVIFKPVAMFSPCLHVVNYWGFCVVLRTHIYLKI